LLETRDAQRFAMAEASDDIAPTAVANESMNRLLVSWMASFVSWAKLSPVA
jgi:hypothetical protein